VEKSEIETIMEKAPIETGSKDTDKGQQGELKIEEEASKKESDDKIIELTIT